MIQEFYGSAPKALMHLFPDIGLSEIGFNSNSRMLRLKQIFVCLFYAGTRAQFLMKTRKWRAAFCSFARSKGFDPAKASGWYTVNRSNLNGVSY